MTSLEGSIDTSALGSGHLSRRGSVAGTSTTPPSPSGHTFDSSLYMNNQMLPPLPILDGAGNGGMLLSGGEGSAAGLPPLPNLPQFDPRSSPPDEEESIDRRPRKRKSVADLRSGGGGAGSSRPTTAEGLGDDDDDDDDKEKGKRKIQIEYIEEKSKRHITFSKRKAGIMKKAYELSTLTGTQVLLLVVSESGWVYTFTTDKFKPLVKEDEHGQLSQGQKLIAACLEAKDGSPTMPDNPSFHPTPNNQHFEANSNVSGGQISIKPVRGSPARPTATNRRVSGKGRQNVPAAIRTGHDANDIPPVPHLPTPMSAGYLDSNLHSPISPRGPRSMPISPRNGGFAQQQQQGQEYAEMLQRADMLHMHQQQQQQYDGPYESMYSSSSSSLPQHSLPILSLNDPLNNHDSYHHDPIYSQGPSQQHYTHHPDANQRGHFQQQQGIGHGVPPMGQPQYGHDEGTYVGR